MLYYCWETMSKEEKDLALALGKAFLRDVDVDDESTEVEDGGEVKSASTPRMRLEAAQLLANKVGDGSNSPSEANLMDEIFKGGTSSFVSFGYVKQLCLPCLHDWHILLCVVHMTE